MGSALPFDRVVVRDGPEALELSAEQFLAQPLHLRIQSILSGRLEFYAGTGQVPQPEALRAISARQRVNGQ